MPKAQQPQNPRPWPLVALCLYALLLGFTLLRHEPWRDELQAWLIARDSHSLQDLWQNTRYEGHPLLWHFLLFLAAKIWPHPAALQVLHFFVASLVAALLLLRAPFPFSLRLGLTFSYFFLFEYGAISRNYALTALFILAFSQFFTKPGSSFSPALMAAFATHSSPMGLVAFPALAWWLFSQKRKGSFLAASGALLAAAAAFWSCWPPPDSGYSRPLFLSWEPLRAQYVLRGLAGALLPVVPAQLQFWNINLLFPMPQDHQGAELLISAGAAFTLLAFGFLLWLFGGRRPFFGWLFGLMSCLAFFYTLFPGTTRHHGIFFLLTVAACWLAPTLSWKKAWLLLGLPVLSGLWSSGWACLTDWKSPFSANKATALWLSSSPSGNLPLAGFPDWAASGVASWFPGRKLFYPNVGGYGTFIRWTKAREQAERHLSPLQALALAKPGHGPFLFLSNQPLPREQAFGCSLVFHLGPVVVPDEAHWLYQCQGEAVLPLKNHGKDSAGSSPGKGE